MFFWGALGRSWAGEELGNGKNARIGYLIWQGDLARARAACLKADRFQGIDS